MPHCPELRRIVSHSVTPYVVFVQNVESTLHYGDWHQYTGSAPRNMGVHITDDFHTYRVDWNPDKMIFYFDGQPYWSIRLDRIMQSPFYKGT